MSGWTAATYLSAAGLGLSVAGLSKKSSSPSAPAPPPAPPPSAAPATLASAATSESMQASKKKEMSAVGGIGAGFDSTIATSPLGTSGAPTTAKAGLLGTS